MHQQGSFVSLSLSLSLSLSSIQSSIEFISLEAADTQALMWRSMHSHPVVRNLVQASKQSSIIHCRENVRHTRPSIKMSSS